MAIFRLLHASDLHIAAKQDRVGLLDSRKAGLRFPRDLGSVALTSSYSPDLLDGLFELVRAQNDQFDAVLLSGDLATTGKEKDLDQARCCIDGDAKGLWYSASPSGRLDIVSHRALTGVGMPPLLLLPGNHDRYDPPLFLPGGTLFDRFFGHYWEVGQRVKAWEFPPKEGVRLGLVSADLSLRKKDPGVGFFGRYGQGRAYVDLIEELEALTDEMSHFGLLWVVHFPPKYPNIDNLLSLLDDENLIKAAHRKGISHLLAGHTHFPHAYNALSADGSDVKVLCAGSATQCVAPEGNFIHDLRIEVGNGKIVSLSFQTYQWSEADQKWVPAACPEKP